MRKAIIWSAAICGTLLAGALVCVRAGNAALPAQTSSQASSQVENDLREFAGIQPIDTHTHAFHVAPEFYSMMQRLDLRVLDICVADSYRIFRPLAEEKADARKFIAGSGGRAQLCTTFDPFPFEKPGYSQRAVAQLNRDFAKGAVAVKIWKNVGMQIQKSDGSYLMPDDPVFSPIYDDIAAHGKTLIAHLAEPSSCWEPPNPASPDYGYYNDNPEWYMYRHPERPKKETILAARDRVLAEHPQLRMVGAHLGSMETDLDEIARHFDRYPNFAVDTAARMEYLMMQPREKARAFLIKYQDRVLYGTDDTFLIEDKPADAVKDWQDTYARDWAFLATDQILDLRGKEVRGLALPRPVLQKIFHDNAIQWIPGVAGPSQQ
ncbi:MAG: amidohydrolase family protein [Candidatus Acidiferrales bacterium]